MTQTELERIDELITKREKNKKLSKKEIIELRELVDKNARMYMIFCWTPEQIESTERALQDAGISAEKFKMPDKYDLTFF